MTTSADLSSVYKQSLTAKGTRLLSIDELLELTRIAKSNLAMVHSIEGYILKGELEVASLEFSLYGPDLGSEKMSWLQQIDSAEANVKSLTDAARAYASPIAFQVWLKEKE